MKIILNIIIPITLRNYLEMGLKTFERSLSVSPDSYEVLVDGAKKTGDGSIYIELQ